MIIQDKLPFNFVNGHGFVRFCQGMNPKWDCGSASYYSRLTDINYEKVKYKLKAKLDIGIAGFWNGIPSLYRYRPAHIFSDSQSLKFACSILFPQQ